MTIEMKAVLDEQSSFCIDEFHMRRRIGELF